MYVDTPPLEREKPRVRLTLVLPDQVNARLEEMARQNGETKTDVLRKAIDLIDVAMKAKSRGHRIAEVDQDRKLVAEFVGL